MRIQLYRVPVLSLALTLLSAIGLTLPSAGHETLRAQIDDLTRQITVTPADASLYLTRAELLRMNEQPQRAEADLREAQRLLPGSPLVDIVRAAMLRDAGRLMAAEAQLDPVIAAAPHLVEARALRAEVRAALGRAQDAISDLDAAIAHTRRAMPDLWLQRARLMTTFGSEGDQRALASLDEGLRTLGPSPALLDLAIDIEARTGATDLALARIDGMLARFPRKETLLARRGEILAAAGRPLEAWVAWSDALTVIEKLPAHKRAAPALVALESRVRLALHEDPKSESTSEPTTSRNTP